MPRQLHFSAALDSPGHVRADHYTALALAAERATLDFVTLDDSFTAAPRRPDALAALARLAPATDRIGLVPTVTTTHTEPFHTSISVNTLDWVSEGRAGWLVAVSGTEEEARAFGRREPVPEQALWAEAADAVEVATRLWDSWEDDAEIRDVATGRFVDRDKLHHTDFQGRYFSVRGPSITPRPPQGRPVVVVALTTDDLPGRTAVATRYADVVLLDAPGPEAARAAADRLRLQAGEQLRILLRLDLALPDEAAADALTGRIAGTAGVDGFHLVPADPGRDLAAFAERVAPALRARGLLRPGYTGRTLRDHLGLARPASRYAAGRAPVAATAPAATRSPAEVSR
ncbi:LLM class flavin-dependent oxidoreductase [Kitasatospora sp. NBC_00240]|uniref:LLM class flavin-dependent oxidoreductase n=1 Tax=Kitasatospora sp. NBC_00240 TaxID=2903567 RepID=UPI00224FB865|nr:LLM class flavin-dependent oxidoreductase [Kitasatospora sp. NBC_00240]MCX5212718.1 LLM class flavin-dependent oxidoreductase [Kitasatospora sp. NBC_00240]